MNPVAAAREVVRGAALVARAIGNPDLESLLVRAIEMLDEGMSERSAERDRGRRRRTARPPDAARSSLSLSFDLKEEKRAEEGERERESGVRLCAEPTSDRRIAGAGDRGLTTEWAGSTTEARVALTAETRAGQLPVLQRYPSPGKSGEGLHLPEPFRLTAVRKRVRDPTHCWERWFDYHEKPPTPQQWDRWTDNERDKLPPPIRAAPDWVEQHGAEQDRIRAEAVPMPLEVRARFLAKAQVATSTERNSSHG